MRSRASITDTDMVGTDMVTDSLPGPRTAVWQALLGHAARLSGVHTRDLVQADLKRFAHFSCEGAGLLLDYSRQKVDEAAMASLAELAEKIGLRERTEAMWRGDAINVTEG